MLEYRTAEKSLEREYKCHCAMCAQLPIAIPSPTTPRVRTLEHAKMVHDFQDKMFLPYQLMHTTAFFLFLFLFFPTVCCLPILFVALLPSFHLSSHFHPPLNQALPSLVTRREGREGNYVNFPAPVERNIFSVRPREQGVWVPERGLCSVYGSRG